MAADARRIAGALSSGREKRISTRVHRLRELRLRGVPKCANPP
jgi:hypothetical protein